MGTNRTGSDKSSAGRTLLVETFNLLDRQRINIDRRLTKLAPDDPVKHEAWQALDPVLADMHDTLKQLAASPAVDLLELRAKADILGRLLRSEVDGRGQVIAEADRTALALSITDDIARLVAG